MTVGYIRKIRKIDWRERRRGVPHARWSCETWDQAPETQATRRLRIRGAFRLGVAPESRRPQAVPGHFYLPN
jgi:hypothetical protein